MLNIPLVIADELKFTNQQVQSVIDLLKEGGTIPFISRYRKDVTGNLDEVGVKGISDRLDYFKELEERKITVLKTIEDSGKMTPELKEKIDLTVSKTELEDLYLPYKPKRRTRASIAKERGLEPLAALIFEQSIAEGDKNDYFKQYISEEKGVPDIETARAGAMDIIAEIINERQDIREFVRNDIRVNGLLSTKVLTDKKDEKTKFEMYYDFKENISNIPSHRILAMRRGEKEMVLLI